MQTTATPLPEIIDIGLNLTHDSFDADRAEILQRAGQVGVTRMLITGSTVTNSRKALELARTDPQRLRATAGVHPHHAAEVDATTDAALRDLLRQPEVSAVGECGLDFFRDFSPPTAQEHAFRMQLAIAREIGKPAFLHQRDAHERFVALLKEFLPLPAGGVAHCFTGELTQARAYLDMGLHIGITGWICDERRGQHLREVVRYIPTDRLLVETDAPYLLPRDLNPKPTSRRNEPMYLPHIVAVIAQFRGEDAASIALTTTRNALQLFGWS
jgi:TatD DNase family protein